MGKVCTTYKISHCFNNKVYIGQTWESNLRGYFNNSHVHGRNRVKLYNAIKKYGRDNFEIEPICSSLTQNAADEAEIFFIKEYNSVKNGYNIKSGGCGGGKLSKESRKKISDKNKGRTPWNKGTPMSAMAKQKLSNSLKGRKAWNKGEKFSAEYRKKLSDAQKGNKNKLGKPCLEETKRKLSLINKGKPSNRLGACHTEEAKKKISEKNRKFSDEQEIVIFNKYNELKSSRKVAAIFNCSQPTILNIIKRQKNKEVSS